jgi:hypothetical protein
MCDYYDNFNDFGENGFMDDDTFEDSIEDKLEMNGSFAGDFEPDDESTEDEPQDDDFTAKDAFVIGGAMGIGYEEGLRERKRRKRKRIQDDD